MEYKGLVVVPTSSSPISAPAVHAIQRVANRSIVCHAVESLSLAGIAEIAIVGAAADLDAVSDCVERDLSTDLAVNYLVQNGRDDLLGALQAAEGFVDDRPAVVHFADGLLGQHLDGLVQDRGSEGLPDLLLLLHRGQSSRGGLEPATQKILGLSELSRHGGRLAVAGVCAFGPAALQRATRGAARGPERADIVAIADRLASAGSNLEAEVVRGWRRYRGDPTDLLELNRLVLDQQVVDGEFVDQGDNRIEGRALVHPTAEVRSSIILGPCIVGAHAKVSDSYIGPYTSIGARAQIEGAEIVRSIIAEDVRIKHIGGRIEGSTIGRNASIFRDFALPRAMRLHVGEGVEVALS